MIFPVMQELSDAQFSPYYRPTLVDVTSSGEIIVGGYKYSTDGGENWNNFGGNSDPCDAQNVSGDVVVKIVHSTSTLFKVWICDISVNHTFSQYGSDLDLSSETDYEFGFPSVVRPLSGTYSGRIFVVLSGYNTITDQGEIRVYEYDSGWIKRDHIDEWSLYNSFSIGETDSVISSGICVTDDWIFVADTYNNLIRKYTRSGTTIMSIGSYGSGDGQLNLPFGIFVKGSQLYACDGGNHRIQVFDFDGNFVSKFGSSGTGDGEFDTPHDIHITEDLIYVVDQGNDRVQVFTLDGSYFFQFGTTGTSNGQFQVPNGIYVSESAIYVSDSYRDDVQIFLLDGTYSSKFGTGGSGDGQFRDPFSISGDGTLLYVADEDNHRIQIFEMDGTYAGQFGSNGNGTNQFNSPRGVYVHNGFLAVLDTRNERIITHNNIIGPVTHFANYSPRIHYDYDADLAYIIMIATNTSYTHYASGILKYDLTQATLSLICMININEERFFPEIATPSPDNWIKSNDAFIASGLTRNSSGDLVKGGVLIQTPDIGADNGSGSSFSIVSNERLIPVSGTSPRVWGFLKDGNKIYRSLNNGKNFTNIGVGSLSSAGESESRTWEGLVEISDSNYGLGAFDSGKFYNLQNGYETIFTNGMEEIYEEGIRDFIDKFSTVVSSEFASFFPPGLRIHLYDNSGNDFFLGKLVEYKREGSLISLVFEDVAEELNRLKPHTIISGRTIQETFQDFIDDVTEGPKECYWDESISVCGSSIFEYKATGGSSLAKIFNELEKIGAQDVGEDRFWRVIAGKIIVDDGTTSSGILINPSSEFGIPEAKSSGARVANEIWVFGAADSNGPVVAKAKDLQDQVINGRILRKIYRPRQPFEICQKIANQELTERKIWLDIFTIDIPYNEVARKGTTVTISGLSEYGVEDATYTIHHVSHTGRAITTLTLNNMGISVDDWAKSDEFSRQSLEDDWSGTSPAESSEAGTELNQESISNLKVGIYEGRTSEVQAHTLKYDTSNTVKQWVDANGKLHIKENSNYFIHDTPVDGATTNPVSSNWAYDHESGAVAHHKICISPSFMWGISNFSTDGMKWYCPNNAEGWMGAHWLVPDGTYRLRIMVFHDRASAFTLSGTYYLGKKKTGEAYDSPDSYISNISSGSGWSSYVNANSYYEIVSTTWSLSGGGSNFWSIMMNFKKANAGTTDYTYVAGMCLERTA